MAPHYPTGGNVKGGSGWPPDAAIADMAPPAERLRGRSRGWPCGLPDVGGNLSADSTATPYGPVAGIVGLIVGFRGNFLDVIRADDRILSSNGSSPSAPTPFAPTTVWSP
jgi:hypothetical protein